MKKFLIFSLFLFVFNFCSSSDYESQPDYCNDFYDLHAEREEKIKEYDRIMNDNNYQKLFPEQYLLLYEILESYESNYSECNIKNIELLKERAYIQWVTAYQAFGMDFPEVYTNWEMITIEELQPIYVEHQEKTGGQLP